MAKLTLCPDCEKNVSRAAEVCPHCGRRLRNRQTAAGLLSAVVLGMVLCWIVVTYVAPRLGVQFAP